MVEIFLADGVYGKKDGHIKDNKAGNINLRGRFPRRQEREEQEREKEKKREPACRSLPVRAN